MGDGTIVVILTYRARNSFGGYVQNYVKASSSIESGEIIEIIERG